MKRLDEIIDRIFTILETTTITIDVIDSIDSDNECTTRDRQFEFGSFYYDKIAKATDEEVENSARDLMLEYEDYIPEEAIKNQVNHIIDVIICEFEDEIQYRISVWDELDDYYRNM